MSKITFRADDDLVEEVERLDASKSEVMREALRSYLDGAEGTATDARPADPASRRLDDVVADRVDELLERRLGDVATPGREVDVNISIEPGTGVANATTTEREPGNTNPGESAERSAGRSTSPPGRQGELGDADAGSSSRPCTQCGEALSADDVYCPNCGQKASQRIFCECGDEVRSDWAFCPHCGRRTASADVLEK